MAAVASARAGGRKPALVFIGFMGAGKSRAARVAAAAGLEALDTDELLEAELGMPIDRFFAERGEEEFRRREGAFGSDLLERLDGGVVALGGGGVLSRTVREALARHVVVWLQVDPATAWERVEGKRPLAHDRDRFAALLRERLPYYEELADAVIPAGEKDRIERALPHLLALRSLPRGTRFAWAQSSSGDYPVFLGQDLLGSGFWPAAGRRFLIADREVERLHGASLGGFAGRITVPPGEASKTLAEAGRVLGELAELGMTRTDHLAALGGGVIGDLGGFCAATYQRGVGVVQLPTTLLAQVDSAYGGKTGVDLPQAKNYVGAYHQPLAVIADTAVLRTLPAEELRAGFVEALKTALIAGGQLWERVRAIETLAPAPLDEVIFACARVKLEVVSADERDAGRRRVLNLGHTVGHAIEAASGYGRYRHGEAVGLGLLAVLRLSGADALREEIVALLARHGLPTALDSEIDVPSILAAIERDKKRDAAGVGFVLLERPGEPRTGARIDAASVRAAVEELR